MTDFLGETILAEDLKQLNLQFQEKQAILIDWYKTEAEKLVGKLTAQLIHNIWRKQKEEKYGSGDPYCVVQKLNKTKE